MYPRTLSCFWWFQKHTLYTAMVDFTMDLDGWLENATLFPTEPDVYNLDLYDYLLADDGKASDLSKAASPQELEWLDKKVDLSILDDPENFTVSSQNAWIIEDATHLLQNLVDSNLDTSLPPSANLSYNFEDTYDLEFQNYDPTNLSSPIYEAISEPNSPKSLVADVVDNVDSPSPTSPSSYVSDAISNCASPAAMSSCSDSDFSSSVVSVTVCNDPDYDPADELLSFEDIAQSVKSRKFVGNATGKIRKVALKTDFHPYSKISRGGHNDRKKRQNKEAAARYRIKKRLEVKERSGEIEELEAEQKKLQQKHGDLVSEIKYLKKLMCEILEKKGMLK